MSTESWIKLVKKSAERQIKKLLKNVIMSELDVRLRHFLKKLFCTIFRDLPNDTHSEMEVWHNIKGFYF